MLHGLFKDEPQSEHSNMHWGVGDLQTGCTIGWERLQRKKNYNLHLRPVVSVCSTWEGGGGWWVVERERWIIITYLQMFVWDLESINVENRVVFQWCRVRYKPLQRTHVHLILLGWANKHWRIISPQYLHYILCEERAVKPEVLGQAVYVEPGYPVGHGTIIINTRVLYKGYHNGVSMLSALNAMPQCNFYYVNIINR